MENSECCTLDFAFCLGVRVELCKPGEGIVCVGQSDRRTVRVGASVCYIG